MKNVHQYNTRATVNDLKKLLAKGATTDKIIASKGLQEALMTAAQNLKVDSKDFNLTTRQ